MIQRLLPTAFLLVVAPLAWASPQEFALQPAPVDVGTAWVVRTTTRVEQEPQLAGRRTLQPQPGDYAQSSAEVRFRVQKKNAKGQVQLRTDSAAQTLTLVSHGERTDEQRPAQTTIEWTTPEALAGAGEIGPTSLLARGTTHVGDSWSKTGELVVGGVAPVRVHMTYTVRAKKVVDGKTLLRITCSGSGSASTKEGETVSVQAKGVLHVDPGQADRPRKVVLMYRFRVSGGDAPPVASRTTLRLETEDLPAKK